MPRFISNGGIWEPATEYAVDPSAPEGQEIYKGPDREAVKMIKENGGQIGQSYTTNPEMAILVRNLGFKSIKDYLYAMNVDESQMQAQYEKLKAKVQRHDPQRKKAPVNPPSGGDDTSGNKRGIKGGFEVPSEASGTRLPKA